MKLFFITILLFSFSIVFSQEKDWENCNIKYEIDTIGLSKTGTIKLSLINKGAHKLKISDKFSDIRIQPINIEKFNSKSNNFDVIRKSISDVNCLNCFGKYKKLKTDETITYSINLNNSHFFKKILTQNKSKYRFNIWFDTVDMIKYSTKDKCFLEDFVSGKIIFKTK